MVSGEPGKNPELSLLRVWKQASLGLIFSICALGW